VGNIGPDINCDEQHANAVRIIFEQRERIEKLERRCARLRELYESSLAVVRRYQSERESLLDRVRGALLGIDLNERDE